MDLNYFLEDAKKDCYLIFLLFVEEKYLIDIESNEDISAILKKWKSFISKGVQSLHQILTSVEQLFDRNHTLNKDYETINNQVNDLVLLLQEIEKSSNISTKEIKKKICDNWILVPRIPKKENLYDLPVPTPSSIWTFYCQPLDNNDTALELRQQLEEALVFQSFKFDLVSVVNGQVIVGVSDGPTYDRIMRDNCVYLNAIFSSAPNLVALSLVIKVKLWPFNEIHKNIILRNLRNLNISPISFNMVTKEIAHIEVPYEQMSYLPASGKISLTDGSHLNWEELRFAQRSPIPPQPLVPPSPGISVPPSPGISVPPSPRISVPPSPRISVPPSPGISVPPSPRISVPPSPGISVPPSPGISVPPSPGISGTGIPPEGIPEEKLVSPRRTPSIQHLVPPSSGIILTGVPPELIPKDIFPYLNKIVKVQFGQVIKYPMNTWNIPEPFWVFPCDDLNATKILLSHESFLMNTLWGEIMVHIHPIPTVRSITYRPPSLDILLEIPFPSPEIYLLESNNSFWGKILEDAKGLQVKLKFIPPKDKLKNGGIQLCGPDQGVGKINQMIEDRIGGIRLQTVKRIFPGIYSLFLREKMAQYLYRLCYHSDENLTVYYSFTFDNVYDEEEDEVEYEKKQTLPLCTEQEEYLLKSIESLLKNLPEKKIFLSELPNYLKKQNIFVDKILEKKNKLSTVINRSPYLKLYGDPHRLEVHLAEKQGKGNPLFKINKDNPKIKVSITLASLINNKALKTIIKKLNYFKPVYAIIRLAKSQQREVERLKDTVQTKYNVVVHFRQVDPSEEEYDLSEANMRYDSDTSMSGTDKDTDLDDSDDDNYGKKVQSKPYKGACVFGFKSEDVYLAKDNINSTLNDCFTKFTFCRANDMFEFIDYKKKSELDQLRDENKQVKINIYRPSKDNPKFSIVVSGKRGDIAPVKSFILNMLKNIRKFHKNIPFDQNLLQLLKKKKDLYLDSRNLQEYLSLKPSRNVISITYLCDNPDVFDHEKTFFKDLQLEKLEFSSNPGQINNFAKVLQSDDLEKNFQVKINLDKQTNKVFIYGLDASSIEAAKTSLFSQWSKKEIPLEIWEHKLFIKRDHLNNIGRNTGAKLDMVGEKIIIQGTNILISNAEKELQILLENRLALENQYYLLEPRQVRWLLHNDKYKQLRNQKKVHIEVCKNIKVLQLNGEKKLEVVMGDIYQQKTDVVVNMVYENMNRSELAEQMSEKGGPNFQKSLQAIHNYRGFFIPGNASIGEPGDLPFKKVVHVMGQCWQGGDNKEDINLFQCVRNVLSCVSNMKYSSVVFPMISGGFPLNIFTTMVLSTATYWLEENLESSVMKVVFCHDSSNFVTSLQSCLNKLATNNTVPGTAGVKPQQPQLPVRTLVKQQPSEIFMKVCCLRGNAEIIYQSVKKDYDQDIKQRPVILNKSFQLSSDVRQEMIDLVSPFLVDLKFEKSLKYCSIELSGLSSDVAEAEIILLKYAYETSSIEEVRYPDNWSEQMDNLQLVSLPTSSNDFRMVRDKFYNSVNQTYNILKIQRIQNMLLWKKYQAKKKSLMEKDKVNELYLFHSNASIPPYLIYNGNTLSLQGMSSQGLSFATNASYSLDKKYKEEENKFQMFMALVLVVDSGSSGNHPTEPYVVYDITHIYPSYLISFSM